MIKNHLTDFEKDLQENLKDPEFKKWYDYYGKQLEVSYTLLQFRKQKKLSQQQLAKKLGTTQSNVARMEAGNQNFSLAMLQKIAHVFEKELEIRFV